MPLLSFAQGFKEFPGILDHPPRIFDTAHVIDELKEYVYTGYSIKGLISTMSSNRVPLLASLHVYNEMYQPDDYGHANKFEKLSKQSRVEGWPTEPAKFRQVFEDYFLPKIHFVDVSGLFDDHPVVQSVGNYKDVPTARLTVLLACNSPVILSRDAHLRKPGLAAKDQNLVIQEAAAMETTEFSIYTSGYVSVAGIQKVNRGIKQASDYFDVSPLVGWSLALIVVGLATAWVLHTPERRESVAKVLAPVVGFYGELVQHEYEARYSLTQLAMPVPDHPTLGQQVARVLTNSRQRSLSGSSILSTLHTDGRNPSTALPPSEDEVQVVLSSHPCFVQSQEGLWELGCVLGPPAGADRPTTNGGR